MHQTLEVRPAPAISAPARPARVRRRRPGEFYLLLAVVGALTIIGLVMVLSASSVAALRQYGSSYLFFKRQLMWVGIGSVALVAAARVDYHRWRRLTAPLLALSLGMLLLVLVPGFGVSVSGSTRWLGFGSFRVQPSELAKLALLLFCADLLSRRADRVHEFGATLRPVALVVAPIALLVMAQPDMGTTMVLGCIVVAVLFVGGVPAMLLGGTLFTSGLVGAALTLSKPYRRARLFCFLHPGKDSINNCYQLQQSLVGLGTGQLTGVGLGASRAKWGFLPNAHTDFIFAIIGEELGLIGTLAVVALFVAFAVLGVRAATRAPDRFGALLAAGVTAWIVGQAIINIGAVIGVLPVTGVPLPFVSFGGSSLVIAMAAVGLLLNVHRQSR